MRDTDYVTIEDALGIIHPLSMGPVRDGVTSTQKWEDFQTPTS